MPFVHPPDPARSTGEKRRFDGVFRLRTVRGPEATPIDAWESTGQRRRLEGAVGAEPEIQAEWLAKFHAGDRAVLEACYREHYDSVFGAVGRILHGADQETVCHEVFFRLVSEPDFRAKFSGGSLKAWLSTVGRNRAIDHLRRRRREEGVEADELERQGESVDGERFVERAEARRLVEEFRRKHLPAKWSAVFEARFMKQLSQRDAADELGMSRTTLAYQELRIRSLLKAFLLADGEEDAQ